MMSEGGCKRLVRLPLIDGKPVNRVPRGTGKILFIYPGVVELADTRDLKSLASAYRFESGHLDHLKLTLYTYDAKSRRWSRDHR